MSRSYNQLLASRVETVLDDLEPLEIVRKKMFDGICYLTQGNIACGMKKFFSNVRATAMIIFNNGSIKET